MRCEVREQGVGLLSNGGFEYYMAWNDRLV